MVRSKKTPVGLAQRLEGLEDEIKMPMERDGWQSDCLDLDEVGRS